MQAGDSSRNQFVVSRRFEKYRDKKLKKKKKKRKKRKIFAISVVHYTLSQIVVHLPVAKTLIVLHSLIIGLHNILA